MITTYDELNTAVHGNYLYKAHYRITFEKLASESNLSIVVMEPDGTIRLSTEGGIGLVDKKKEIKFFIYKKKCIFVHSLFSKKIKYLINY